MAGREREILEHAVYAVTGQAAKADANSGGQLLHARRQNGALDMIEPWAYLTSSSPC
jgi:hypothetical protein